MNDDDEGFKDATLKLINFRLWAQIETQRNVWRNVFCEFVISFSNHFMEMSIFLEFRVIIFHILEIKFSSENCSTRFCLSALKRRHHDSVYK